jgi:RNA polymerase sigma factor (TIGR02999 family)
MADSQPGKVTQVLKAVEQGDPQAAERLLPLVYSELRAIARALMAKVPPGNTLQPTALVHEAYMRLVRNEDPGWNSRGHFFAAAAQAMRRILVEQARRKAALKHGGDQQRMEVDEAEIRIESPSEDLLALDQALERLAQWDRRKARVVELRYLVGLDIAETAQVLGVSEPTVEREWRFARAFLFDLLARPDPEGREPGHE